MTSAPHFRSGTRRPVALRVRFRIEGSDTTHEAKTTDLSMGGAFVETRVPPAPGTDVRLELDAPTAWDPLVVPADVRWAAHGARLEGAARAGFGARFGALSLGQVGALQALLRAVGYGPGGSP